MLKSNDYKAVLRRGFSLVKNKNNELISSSNQVKIDDEIFIEMADDTIKSRVI